MTPPKASGSRTEAKRRTRAALIEAGAALFSEEGLDGPSLDAICERAGFTRGAFYVHFKDRDDFLVAVMQFAGGPSLDALIAAEEEATMHDLVIRFVRAVAEGTYPLSPRGGIRPHQLMDACARSPRVREMYVNLVIEAIRRLARVINTEQVNGTIRKDVQHTDLSALLLALIIGAQTMLDLEVPFDFSELASTAMRLVAGS